MLRSRQAVKSELRARGLKARHLSASEDYSWAQVFLDDHATKVIPEAIAHARAMILSGAMGKRAAKAFKEQLGIEQSQVERSVANG